MSSANVSVGQARSEGIKPRTRSRQMKAIRAHGGGRRRSDGPRCWCGKYTLHSTRQRGFQTGRYVPRNEEMRVTDEQRKRIDEYREEQLRLRAEKYPPKQEQGPLPYRWGYWCAAGAAFGVLRLISYATGLPAGTSLGVYAGLVLMAGLWAVASVGVFRKKRRGVKLLFIGNGLIVISVIVGLLVAPGQVSTQKSASLVGIPFWFWISYMYFKKRWHELS